MSITSKIILAFMLKGIGLVSLFAGFMSIAFADSKELSFLVGKYHIHSLFFLTFLFAFLANVCFYFKAVFNNNAVLADRLMVAFALCTMILFSLAVYRYINLDQYRDEILRQRTLDTESTISKYSGTSRALTEEDMGFLLYNESSVGPEQKQRLVQILKDNADFAFGGDYRRVGYFDDKISTLYTKGEHIVDILLLNRDYETLNAISEYIKNPNYRNPDNIGLIGLDKSIFQNLVSEFTKYEYADVGMTIKNFLAHGADTNILVDGKDLQTSLIEARERYLKIATNPRTTSDTANICNQKLIEIDEILKMLPSQISNTLPSDSLM